MNQNPMAVYAKELNESDCWDCKANVPMAASLRWRLHDYNEPVIAMDPERDGVRA